MYFEICLVSVSNTPDFQNTPTIVSGDFKIRLDGSGATTNLVNIPTVTGKVVRIDLDAAEWDEKKGIIIWEDAADDEWLPGYLVFDNTESGATTLVDALLDMDDAVESGLTVRQLLRLLAATNGGKLNGAAGTTLRIRDTNDTKNRVTATVDASGNRAAVTLDLD